MKEYESPHSCSVVQVARGESVPMTNSENKDNLLNHISEGFAAYLDSSDMYEASTLGYIKEDDQSACADVRVEHGHRGHCALVVTVSENLGDVRTCIS